MNQDIHNSPNSKTTSIAPVAPDIGSSGGERVIALSAYTLALRDPNAFYSRFMHEPKKLH